MRSKEVVKLHANHTVLGDCPDMDCCCFMLSHSDTCTSE